MSEIPAFKSHLQVEVLSGEGVLILSEERDSAKALHGNLFEKVVSATDGIRTADTIVDLLSDQLPAAHVYYALNLLENKGYLSKRASSIPNNVAAFWDGLGCDPLTANNCIARKSVRVRTVGATNAETMMRTLEAADIKMVDSDDADLEIVLTDDYLRSELRSIYMQLRNAGRPWLLVKPVGFEPWIGPLYLPHQSGCYGCLSARLRRNRPLNLFVARKKGFDEPVPISRASLPSTEAIAVQIAAVESAKFLATGSSTLIQNVLSLDIRDWSTQVHTWLAHPACTLCAPNMSKMPAPIELVSSKAKFVKDGGHRIAAPEDTLAKYGHLVSPITGVVPALAAVECTENSGFVYMAGLNSTVQLSTLDMLRQGLRNICSGKGASANQAKASALCEALERYSFEFMGNEFRISASYNKLGSDAIHPNDVLLFSEHQYQYREKWNARKSKFNWVPEQFDENEQIDWTPVWSLTEKRHKYLPTQLLYFGAKAREGSDRQFSRSCSNGNAAGNNLEEAVLQGFFELVERDATSIWWYNRLSKAAVDLGSFKEPYLNDFVESYSHSGREVWALDLTSDLGIPTFVALSRNVFGGEERIMLGLGCHFDAKIALKRAFGEMNQMFCIANSAESNDRLEDAETIEWLKTATISNQPYLCPDKNLPAKQFADYPKLHTGDLLDDILTCKQMVENLGLEMLVLDQTRADIAMPAAKVIVPGLRHYWARFRDGRLYDVPVKMGWLKARLREDELNPIPVFV
ncbi:MAG: TOMM precursor leader peptide-binding protein [Candidatus Obscuribacterales bacterium]|nr:TOMM precursor leader peptide-binding protein [Candidatus Obscuribacterales bacterium]